MKINFKAIQKQLYLLHYLLNENRQIGANRKQLFVNAVKENQSKSRRNNPLVLQLANELAATMLIIEEQKAVIEELHDNISELQTQSEIGFLDVWNILETILDHDKSFHFPQSVLMRLQNPNDENRSIQKEINPRDVICITSLKEGRGELQGNQRRKKLIFYKDVSPKSEWEYKCFMLNNDKNFIELWQEIDGLAWFMCPVNKNTIVGVHYYDLAGNKLTLNEECQLEGLKHSVEISKEMKVKDIPALELFRRIKAYNDDRVLLQKKAIGFKERAGL